MIEQFIVKHLAVNNHTEGIALRYLTPPGAPGVVTTFTCTECGLSCNLSDKMTFVDWDLDEFSVCPPCLYLKNYHKIQRRKKRPYHFLKQEFARKLGVPFP